jgi:hypothetical protein
LEDVILFPSYYSLILETMLNVIISILVNLLIAGIFVAIAFWLIDFFVADPKLNKGMKGIIVIILFLILLVWMFGGGYNFVHIKSFVN